MLCKPTSKDQILDAFYQIQIKYDVPQLFSNFASNFSSRNKSDTPFIYMYRCL